MSTKIDLHPTDGLKKDSESIQRDVMLFMNLSESYSSPSKSENMRTWLSAIHFSIANDFFCGG